MASGHEGTLICTRCGASSPREAFSPLRLLNPAYWIAGPLFGADSYCRDCLSFLNVLGLVIGLPLLVGAFVVLVIV